MSRLPSLARVLHEAATTSGPVSVSGWLTYLRVKKKDQLSFLHISDGSTETPLQLVTGEVPRGVRLGTYISAQGEMRQSPGRTQEWELAADSIRLVGRLDDDFTLRSSQALAATRAEPHLRGRLPLFQQITRARARLASVAHDYMRETGFSLVHTPFLTRACAEADSAAFTVQGMEESEELEAPRLTVSSQLHLEAALPGLSRVYNLAPTWRAEPSHGRLHLAEFFMLEAEAAPISDLSLLADWVEEVVTQLTSRWVECSAPVEAPAAERAEPAAHCILSGPFARVTFPEAQRLLKSNRPRLGRDEELQLVKLCGGRPVLLLGAPASEKPFYMARDGDTALALDLLLPSVGEVVGGGVREADFDSLLARLPSEELMWYADLRRFGGAPSAGFGLGFDRLLMALLGLRNIRDVVAFPRSWDQCRC